MSWTTVRADEFCESVRDGTHDTPKQTETGYKLVTGKHIKNGQIDPSNAYYISEKDYKKINDRSLVEQWDVLMSMIGTVGEVAVVKDRPNYAIKNVALFKCAGSELKGKWLAYYLRSSDAQGHMSGNQKGSSQQFLSLKQLRSLPIPITDEQYMQRVIDILSAYDDLIENNQKQIKLLEEAAQRLYKEWFVDLRFPSHETTPITDGIFEGWTKGKIADFVPTFSGGTPSRSHPEYYSEGTNLWVKTQELNDSFLFDTEEKITNDAVGNSSAKIIPQGSILMAMYGATIGKLGIAAKELTCNQACCVFDLTNIKFATSYLFLWLKENREFFISQGKGAAQPNLSQATIKQFDIIIPSDKVLKAFAKVTDALLERIAKLQLQIIRLTEARDRLLPKLMNREIEV